MNPLKTPRNSRGSVINKVTVEPKDPPSAMKIITNKYRMKLDKIILEYKYINENIQKELENLQNTDKSDLSFKEVLDLIGRKNNLIIQHDLRKQVIMELEQALKMT